MKNQIKKHTKVFLIVLCAIVLMSSAAAAVFLFNGDGLDTGDQVQTVFFQEDSVTIEKYETYTLTLLGAEDKEIEWKSNDESIATVQDGVVCGWKKGNTQILASIDDMEVSCDVMVLDNQYVPVIQLGEPDGLMMDIGSTYRIKPVLHYNGNAYTDVEYTYSIAENAVKVDEAGVLTAAEEGDALVLVQGMWRNNVVEASLSVNVIDASTSIEVSDTVFDIYLNGRGEDFPSKVDVGISVFDKDEPVREQDAAIKYIKVIMDGDVEGAAYVEKGIAYAAELGTTHFVAEYTSREGAVVRSAVFTVNVHQSPSDKYMMPIAGQEYEFFFEPLSPTNSVVWDEKTEAFHLVNTVDTESDARGFAFNKEYIENIIRYTGAKSIVFEVKTDGIPCGVPTTDKVIFQGFYPEWFRAGSYQRIDKTDEWTKIEIFFDDIPFEEDGSRKSIFLLNTNEGMYIRNIRPVTEGLFLTMDVSITTLGGNWNEDIELGLFPYSYKGSINDCTSRAALKAGTVTTVKVRLDDFLENGKLPGFGFAVFGGPTWDAVLEDGYTPDRHTITVSNLRVTGEANYSIDVSTISWTSGTSGTGFTDANGAGIPDVVDGALVITGGYRYDAHKISLNAGGQKKDYIYMDMEFTTLDNSAEKVEIGFYPYHFEGDINDYTDKIAVTAGATATVKLDASKYMVDGELSGIGFAVFGGPAWDAVLEDGYTPDRHEIKISNMRLEGSEQNTFDLSNATVASGQSGTGYTNANGSGVASVKDGTIVITGGFRYDGHKITLNAVENPEDTEPEVTEPGTYISMDMLVDTLGGNWTDDIEIGFFPHNFEGDINNFTDKFVVKAGEQTTIKLDLEKYLVDGAVPGIGFSIFGGPAWDAVLEDGYTPDRHTVTISNVRLEGKLAQSIDLNTAAVTSGANAGYTNANGSGVASIVDGTIVITGGFRYDGHKITLNAVENPEDTEPGTYISMNMLIDTLGGNWTDDIEIGFFPHSFEGDINNFTDKFVVKAGEQTTIKLDIEKYLVDGAVPGIGFAIFGGPAWDAVLEDGYTPDRHTVTISNVRLEGGKEQVFDLNQAAVASGQSGTGYTNAQGSGVASIVDGTIVITGGYRYDGHKITLDSIEEPEVTEPEVTEPSTYISMDMLVDTLGGNWTDDIEIGFFPYGFEGDINNMTDKVTVTAGTTAAIKLNADNYLVDGAFPGVGFAIFGGPAWDAVLEDGSTPDRHTVTISNVRLEGGKEQVFDLNQAAVASGTNGTGYTNAQGSGVASIVDGTVVITGGYRYDAHKVTLNARTVICVDMLVDTLGGNWTDNIEIGFFPHSFEGDINNYTDKIAIKAGEQTTIKLDMEKYLVGGAVPGIGFAIFGGPEWNTQIFDGVYDRHTVTISNVRLEGKLAQSVDLSTAAVTSGVNAGYTTGQGVGVASVSDTIVITGGYRYDAHKITLNARTFICADMLVDTLGGNWTDDIEIGFFPYGFEGNINNMTDKVTVTAGTTAAIKLNADNYLVDGALPGIGFAIFGGPSWDAKLEDGYTPDRHTITISNVRLEGGKEQTFDLNQAAVASGQSGTGYTNAQGSGVASIVDGTIVITGGYRYDGHKITFGVQERSCIIQQPAWLPPEPPLKKEKTQSSIIL